MWYTLLEWSENKASVGTVCIEMPQLGVTLTERGERTWQQAYGARGGSLALPVFIHQSWMQKAEVAVEVAAAALEGTSFYAYVVCSAHRLHFLLDPKFLCRFIGLVFPFFYLKCNKIELTSWDSSITSKIYSSKSKQLLRASTKCTLMRNRGPRKH